MGFLPSGTDSRRHFPSVPFPPPVTVVSVLSQREQLLPPAIMRMARQTPLPTPTPPSLPSPSTSCISKVVLAGFWTSPHLLCHHRQCHCCPPPSLQSPLQSSPPTFECTDGQISRVSFGMLCRGTFLFSCGCPISCKLMGKGKEKGMVHGAVILTSLHNKPAIVLYFNNVP